MGASRKGNIKKKSVKCYDAAAIKLKNLPFSGTSKDVKSKFKQFGGIYDVKLLKGKDGKKTGNAIVTFKNLNAAQVALDTSCSTEIMGRKIEVVWANPGLHGETGRSKPQKTTYKMLNNNLDTKNEFDLSKVKQEEEEDKSFKEESEDVDQTGDMKYSRNQYSTSQPLNSQKKLKAKRGKIIVRNLSFKTTEEALLKHFEEFGPVEQVNLLKKKDGKLVGCGFVEFQKKQHAIKAILERSGKCFLGRPIVCDWALSKDQYLEKLKSEERVKVKTEVIDDLKLKKESDINSSDEVSIKSEMEDDEGEDYREGEGGEEEEEEGIDYGDVKEEKEWDDDSDDESSSPKWKKMSHERKRVISNDVSEGCTVFVKNIPFSACKEDLAECMNQFGPIYYAVICVDNFTEHSKGTGFVKFKRKEDATKCIEASSQLLVAGQHVEARRAISREEVHSLTDCKKLTKAKDNRCLYLVKEGVVIAGSAAAKGVSVWDMEKRLKIEQYKTQILRNLNTFVSKTRLVVHNLPQSWKDHQVHQLFKKYAGPGAVVKEARVMRDRRNCDENGVGTSKEYAFVELSTHEHALQALRNINNNPDIFTPGKRPIVSFSIEDKAIHRIKQRRLEKSLAHSAQKGIVPRDTRRHKKVVKQTGEASSAPSEMETPVFSGVEAKPGNMRMRKKFSLKAEALAHQKNVKKTKRLLKMRSERQTRIQNRKLKNTQPKSKKKMKQLPNDNFDKLVEKYKSKLVSATPQKHWYE